MDIVSETKLEMGHLTAHFDSHLWWTEVSSNFARPFTSRQGCHKCWALKLLPQEAWGGYSVSRLNTGAMRPSPATKRVGYFKLHSVYSVSTVHLQCRNCTILSHLVHLLDMVWGTSYARIDTFWCRIGLNPSVSPFLGRRTWSRGRVLLGGHLYKIHEWPQSVPNAIAIQSLHKQLLELKPMLRDRILDGFRDHCFNVWPESISYDSLHKAVSSQAFYSSESPKSTVFITTKVLFGLVFQLHDPITAQCNAIRMCLFRSGRNWIPW